VAVQGDYVEKKSKLLSLLEKILWKNSPYILNGSRIRKISAIYLAETVFLRYDVGDNLLIVTKV